MRLRPALSYILFIGWIIALGPALSVAKSPPPAGPPSAFALRLSLLGVRSLGREPTAFPYLAKGFGFGAALHIERTFPKVIVATRLQGTQAYGAMSQLSGFAYRDQAAGQALRYGMAYNNLFQTDLEARIGFLFTDSARAARPFSFVSGVGLAVGQLTSVWLHPVTTTRVYLFRPWVAVGYTYRFLYVHGSWQFGLTGFLSPALYTSTVQRTNEGRERRLEPGRLTLGQRNAYVVDNQLYGRYQYRHWQYGLEASLGRKALYRADAAGITTYQAGLSVARLF